MGGSCGTIAALFLLLLAIAVSEVSLGLDLVANELLYFFRLWESTGLLSGKNQLAV